MPTLRPELDPLPPRLARLPVDGRGYPVPWFVLWRAGVPEFREMDVAKMTRAVRERRCWICGDVLGVHLTFPLGPMCAINRNISEPPSHYECARWSVLNCPFLTRPQMVRREDDRINPEAYREHCAGVPILRNPGVMALWTTLRYRIVPDPRGRPLFNVGEPERVEWYTQRRAATRAEVEAAIEAGLPVLVEATEPERRGEARLALSVARRRLVAQLPRS